MSMRCAVLAATLVVGADAAFPQHTTRTGGRSIPTHHPPTNDPSALWRSAFLLDQTNQGGTSYQKKWKRK